MVVEGNSSLNLVCWLFWLAARPASVCIPNSVKTDSDHDGYRNICDAGINNDGSQRRHEWGKSQRFTRVAPAASGRLPRFGLSTSTADFFCVLERRNQGAYGPRTAIEISCPPSISRVVHLVWCASQCVEWATWKCLSVSGIGKLMNRMSRSEWECRGAL